jgi:hypothetical protein
MLAKNPGLKETAVYTPHGIKLCPVPVYKITICARVRYNCQYIDLSASDQEISPTK